MPRDAFRTTVVLTAHGSRDPRSAANTRAIAGHLRRLAPELSVRVAFCEHSTPNLRDVLASSKKNSLPKADGEVVIVPFLLASAYHARIDIPEVIAQSGASDIVRVAPTLGEDDRLVQVLGERLSAAGASRFDPELGVVVVAVGSSHPAANAQTAQVAAPLFRGTRWAGVEVAFATAKPSIPEAVERLAARGATRLMIAPWFLAHGRITDGVAGYAARAGIPMAEPLGAHRLVAATVLDRVDEALSTDRVAA